MFQYRNLVALLDHAPVRAFELRRFRALGLLREVGLGAVKLSFVELQFKYLVVQRKDFFVFLIQ